ncbi:MAG: hypothetical protein ACTTJF_06080 [Campylobacter sp.]|uniref:hypothetical protein n=1 Tax=Campylobacter sp. TaxID=205 RepID=UPI003FA0F3ED
MANDAWKEEFLEQIFSKKLLQSKQEYRYLITAVPKFYNQNLEKEFGLKFKEVLDLDQ